MVIFGGIDQAGKASSVVHVFNLTIEAWRLAEPVGTGIGGSVPSARRGHTAVCLDNTMIVYGKNAKCEMRNGGKDRVRQLGFCISACTA